MKRRIRVLSIIVAAVIITLLGGCGRLKELQYSEKFPFGINTTQETKVARDAIEYMNNKYKDDHFTLDHVFESTTIMMKSEKYPYELVEVHCNYDKETKEVSYEDTYIFVKFDKEMQKEAESFFKDVFSGSGMEIQSVSSRTTLISHEEDSEKTTFEEVRKRVGNHVSVTVKYEEEFEREEIEERIKKELSERGLTASVTIVFQRENAGETERMWQYDFYMLESDNVYSDTNEKEWRKLNE